MDVRVIHGALLREGPEPWERFRQMPWYVKHSFLVLIGVSILYLLMQRWDWKEYEEDPVRRKLRDLSREQVVTP